MKYYIYGLFSTENNIIRYVGQTRNPLKERLNEHKCDALTRNFQNHKCNWIRNVYNNGFQIGIKLIEEADEVTWADKEKYWIKELKESNKLVNQLEGGNSGGLGGKRTNFLSYNEAKKFIKDNMGILSSGEKYRKELKKHPEWKNILPLHPEDVYLARNEWQNMYDYLGKEIKEENMTYQNAVNFLSSKNLHSREEYHNFIKKEKINLPYKPERYYSKEWKNYSEYLSKNKIVKQNKIYNNLKELKNYINENHIRTYKEYKEIKNKPFPNNIKKAYSSNKGWKGIYDLFPTSQHIISSKKDCSLELFKRYISLFCPNISSAKEWKIFLKENNVSKRLPKRPDLKYNMAWHLIFCNIKPKDKELYNYSQFISYLKKYMPNTIKSYNEYRIFIQFLNNPLLSIRPQCYYKKKWSNIIKDIFK